MRDNRCATLADHLAIFEDQLGKLLAYYDGDWRRLMPETRVAFAA